MVAAMTASHSGDDDNETFWRTYGANTALSIDETLLVGGSALSDRRVRELPGYFRSAHTGAGRHCRSWDRGRPLVRPAPQDAERHRLGGRYGGHRLLSQPQDRDAGGSGAIHRGVIRVC